MSAMTPQKRQRPDSKPGPLLTRQENDIYKLIMSKKEMGIWAGDIKNEIKYPASVIDKAVKGLQAKNLVKLVSTVNSKMKKRLMGIEFEPAKEISGGSWYSDGLFDSEFVGVVRTHCLNHIKISKVATIDSILTSIQNSPVFTTTITHQQITELAQSMILDGLIEEVKSVGRGGVRCYRFLRGTVEPKTGIFSSIPCGVCPRISECTPDGIISPKNCVYFNRWIGLDF